MDYQLASPECYPGDPAPAYRALRHRSPVHWTVANGGFWAISRYEDVRWIGVRPQLFEVNDDGELVVLRTNERAGAEIGVAAAVEGCPTQALSLEV